MRKLFLLILVLLAVIGIGYAIMRDSGYVMMSYGLWTMEMSIWVLILLWIASLFLLFFLFGLKRRGKHLKGRFHLWRRQTQQEKSEHLLSQGLCDLIEGNWDKAEQALAQAREQDEYALVGNLAAAIAAQKQQASAKRDAYLKQAQKQDKDASFAIRLLNVRLQVEAKEWSAAETALNGLSKKYSHHPQVLQLQSEVYQQQASWDKLASLVPQLRKRKVFLETELAEIEQNCTQQLLRQALEQADLQALESVWHDSSRAVQQALLKEYANALVQLRQGDTASHLIEQQLKKTWQPELLELYVQAASLSNKLHKKIQQAKHWLKKHPDNAELLLCLGQLYLQQQEWLLAREALEKSLSLKAQPSTHFALAQALEKTGEQYAALKHYGENAGVSTS